MLTIHANASFNSPKFNPGKRIQQGRDRYEKSRSLTAKRIQDDLRKIAKNEVEFSKSLIKHIVPVDISIDKNATGLKKLIPLNIAIQTFEDWNIEPTPSDPSSSFTPSSGQTTDSSTSSDAFLSDIE